MDSWFAKIFISALVLVGALSLFWPPVLWSLIIIAPLAAIGIYDRIQQKHSLWRNFPLFGRGRWIMEAIRPYVRQYFVESDTDGAPINRMFRNIVYQRAKNELDTVPYGTMIDTYRTGYEWMGHSLAAIHVSKVDADLRIHVR